MYKDPLSVILNKLGNVQGVKQSVLSFVVINCCCLHKKNHQIWRSRHSASGRLISDEKVMIFQVLDRDNEHP